MIALQIIIIYVIPDIKNTSVINFIIVITTITRSTRNDV